LEATPPKTGAVPIVASVALLATLSLFLVVGAAALDNVTEQIAEEKAKHAFEPPLPVRGMVDGPVGINLLVLIVVTWFCGRGCAARWNHPDPGLRWTARMAMYATAAIITMTLAGLVLVRPALYGHPVILALAVSWIGIAGLSARKSKHRPPQADLPARASIRDRLLVNAGLLGMVVPPVVMATGMSTALTWPLGWKRFLVPLFGYKTDAGYLPPSVDGSIQWIFASHLLTSLYITVAWMAVAALHARTILWWQSRGRKGLRSDTSSLLDLSGLSE
jgi:hypothetical protein